MRYSTIGAVAACGWRWCGGFDDWQKCNEYCQRWCDALHSCRISSVHGWRCCDAPHDWRRNCKHGRRWSDVLFHWYRSSAHGCRRSSEHGRRWVRFTPRLVKEQRVRLAMVHCASRLTEEQRGAGCDVLMIGAGAACVAGMRTTPGVRCAWVSNNSASLKNAHCVPTHFQPSNASLFCGALVAAPLRSPAEFRESHVAFVSAGLVLVHNTNFSAIWTIHREIPRGTSIPSFFQSLHVGLLRSMLK